MPVVNCQNGAEPGRGMAGSQGAFPDGGRARSLHLAWQAGTVVTIAAGLFHLINLAGPSREVFGPLLMTPFRLAFIISWALLAAGFIAEHRWPRLDRVDALVGAAAAVFLLRGVFAPETLGITLNLIVTGAGVFYLVKHGVRDRRDVRLIAITIAAAVVAIALAGVAEYIAKQNPLFESTEVDVIGTDARVTASKQFYRIRSLIGHPGFVGAVLVGGAPMVMLVLWRRRYLLGVSLFVMFLALFLTFSRGSWLLGTLFFAPVLVYSGRHWLKRSAKWLGPAAIVFLIFIAVDYTQREEVSARLGKGPSESGLFWVDGGDGPFVVVSGRAEGVLANKHFLYFDVGDGFSRDDPGPVTVTVEYFDNGTGAVNIEYDSQDEGGPGGGAFTPSGRITKANGGRWTQADFLLEKPRFDGRQNGGADFRIVDNDNLTVVKKVVVRRDGGPALTWTMDLDRAQTESGLNWTQGLDGPYMLAGGRDSGARPFNHFLYFDVDDNFYRAGHGSATVVVHYLDRGTGAIHVEYDSWDEEAGKQEGALTPSGYINKTDTGRWTSAAFLLENPRFDGRQNGGADFRIVDDDNQIVVDRVDLQKGKLKLPTVISQQWISRAGSFGTRMELYPFAWSVLMDHPLGVGLFNTPGTGHHAVDSLPLTWIMEFGWLALPMLGLIGWAMVREGILVFRARSGPAMVLYLSLALLLLHGAHLMILYDKPSLILFSAAGALYALVRPGRRGAAHLDVSSKDCIL